MNRVSCIALALCCSLTARAAHPPVKVETETMTLKVTVADYAPDSNKPIKSTKKDEEKTVEVVKLNNGLVEAWVAPAWGARLLRAIDLKTKADYFRWKQPVEGHLGFGGVGVEASFPFFEHGMRLFQPAGCRVIEQEDGSATVAMDMRFTHHQEERDRARYGRYSDEILSVMVTVRPGTTAIEWRQRKDNPNPMPRSDRFWNNALFEVKRIMKAGKVKKRNPKYKKGGKDPKWLMVDGMVCDKEATEAVVKYIYPARYVVDHGPTVVHASPHWSNHGNWCVSHFAIDAIYGFIGRYDSRERTSCLRINDVEQAPAAKLYSCNWTDMCEFWGGVGYVFEHPGNLRPAHEPVEFSHRFYMAQDIGQVDFANDDVAVAVDGKSFELMSPVLSKAVVKDGSGKEVTSGNVGPHTVLKGSFGGKRLVVALDGRDVLDQAFPLDLPSVEKDKPVPSAIQAKFETLRKYVPSRPELEQVMNNPGLTRTQDAIGQAAKVTKDTDEAKALSLARTCYRLGHVDEALRIAGLFKGEDARFITALVALEKGDKASFKKTGWQSSYLQALQMAAEGKQDKAAKLAGDYIKEVPKAWYPRLAKAYWEEDLEAATMLAEENPASPEAQLVLKLLGEKAAKKALKQLLADNPSAEEQVEAFEKQITKGEWKHARRYQPVMPAE